MNVAAVADLHFGPQWLQLDGGCDDPSPLNHLPTPPSETPPFPSASTPGLLAPGVGHIHLAAFSLALAAGKHNNKV